MSNMMGEVIKEGKVVGYYEYNGTWDMARSDIHPTEEAVIENWGEDCTHVCNCESKGEPVILYSSYGGGFHWPATTCLKCGAILEGREWPATDDMDGHPLGEEHAKQYH